MYNKLPNTNKMEWEKVQNLSLFFQSSSTIENNLLHYLTLYSIVAETRCHVINYERVGDQWEIEVKMLDFSIIHSKSFSKAFKLGR